MTFVQKIINDVFLLVLIVGLLLYFIVTQRRLEMKIANIEAEYDLLLESKEGPIPKEENIDETPSGIDEASDDRTPGDFEAFQESANKRLEENEKELKKVIAVLGTVTQEIKNLKDSIKERTIDLEL